MQIRSRTRFVDVERIVGDVEDHRLTGDLRSCQQFLVALEFERARHNVFNYPAETLNERIVNEKLDQFFNNLKFGFWLHFEKYRRRRVQIFLRTRKQYPVGLIEACVHP